MSIELIEVVWVVLATAALAWTYQVYREAKFDLRVQEATGHRGARWTIATSSFRRERLKLLSQFLLLMAGLVSMARPEVFCPPRDAYGIAILICFFGVIIILLLNTVLDARERTILLQMAVERDESTLSRIEAQGTAGVERDRVVASDLHESQGRADATEGEAGSAADAASKSAAHEQREE